MAAILSCGAMLNQRPRRRGCLIEFLYPTVAGLALRLRLSERRSAAPLDERGLAHAHSPLPRGGREPPDVRLPPDPPRHGDAPCQQRDAARGGEPVSRAFLDRRHPPVRPTDP